MIGRAVLTALIVMAATPAAAAPLCPHAPAKPIFKVQIAEEPIDFVADKTREELAIIEAAQHGEDPAARGTAEQRTYHSFVGGLMQGEAALYHDVEFDVATDKRTGRSCAWITQVNVRLTLAPVIYVAKDLQQQDCWHREVYRHELKHIEADRKLLQKYAGQMTDGMGMAFSTPADYVSRPFAHEDLEVQRETLREVVAYPLGVMFEAMLRERPEAHEGVDTPGEYARVAGICEKTLLPGVDMSQVRIP